MKGFTREQLTNLGVTGKDVPIAAQTPLFPPLISRPIEIQSNVALDYKITWKEDFRSHLFDIHSKSELNLNDDSYSNKVAVSRIVPKSILRSLVFHRIATRFAKLCSEFV